MTASALPSPTPHTSPAGSNHNWFLLAHFDIPPPAGGKSAGVLTIGIGSTRDLAGKPVTASAPSVTRAVAEQMAEKDLAVAADRLAADFPAGLLPRWWAVGVTNNLGRNVWGAIPLRLLRAKGWLGAAEQMKAYRNAGRSRRWPIRAGGGRCGGPDTWMHDVARI